MLGQVYGCFDGFGAKFVGSINSFGVSITPDGCYAVCNGDRNGLQVFDLACGHYISARGDYESAVAARVSITPDGRYAVYANDEGTVRKWDVNSGRCLGAFCETALHVDAIRLSPDGRRAVLADEDGSLCVLDLEMVTGRLVTWTHEFCRGLPFRR